MKTTIMIRENRTQLVLEPENDHDKSVLKLLEQMPNTHRCDFFDTEGGFSRGISANTMYNSHVEDLIIVFDKAPKQE